MGVCGTSSLTSFYGQLVMSSFPLPIGTYWCFMAFGPHHLSLAFYDPRPYPALIGLFGQLSTSPIPRPIPLFWAWGVHLDFQGPLAPLATISFLRPTPLITGLLGHLDPLWPLWGQVGPNLISPTKGQKHPRTQIGQEPLIGHFQPLAFWKLPEATKSISARFPLHSGERHFFTNVLCTMDSGMVHIWYDIPLCTNFDQKSNGDDFRNKLGHFKPSPQIHHPFQRKYFQSFNLAINGTTRRPFEDPNHLALQELGCTFFQDPSKGNLKRLSSIQSAVKASSTSVSLGQLNWSIQVAFKQAVWPWPFWANSYSTVGTRSHSSIFKMDRSVLTQHSQYSQGSTLQDQPFNL
ncbi:hypothetical protein O181_114894 [Austropuccinia psidii MF-1]|uniref:Uncharacterized protein n=1 Tax=Austropuccinia psidii MF-1 TaxID=1389203 RepID=A0A9Q3PV28_9BASI|nr:hypothetical protein [Austropuccinia psidii MF-1]